MIHRSLLELICVSLDHVIPNFDLSVSRLISTRLLLLGEGCTLTERPLRERVRTATLSCHSTGGQHPCETFPASKPHPSPLLGSKSEDKQE